MADARLTAMKSSYSNGISGCVDVKHVPGERVEVRDDKEGPEAEVQVYSIEEWRAFLKGVHDGEFDFGLL